MFDDSVLSHAQRRISQEFVLSRIPVNRVGNKCPKQGNAFYCLVQLRVFSVKHVLKVPTANNFWCSTPCFILFKIFCHLSLSLHLLKNIVSFRLFFFVWKLISTGHICSLFAGDFSASRGRPVSVTPQFLAAPSRPFPRVFVVFSLELVEWLGVPISPAS